MLSRFDAFLHCCQTEIYGLGQRPGKDCALLAHAEWAYIRVA